ncbi:acyl-CoA dehydrogenase, partial [Azospirillum brasilense]|nr:acyl-CoA dehydrogenase [Azospirillum brasilense]
MTASPMTVSATSAKDWIGRSETVSDTVTPTPYAGLSATRYRPAGRPPPGTPPRPLWRRPYCRPLHR